MPPVAFPHDSVVTPCEIMESKAPILFLRKELRPHSAGAGQHRGGLGQTIKFRHVGASERIHSISPTRSCVHHQGSRAEDPESGAVVLER